MSMSSIVKTQELHDLENLINGLIARANTIAKEHELSFTLNIPSYGTHTIDWTSSWSDSYD